MAGPSVEAIAGVSSDLRPNRFSTARSCRCRSLHPPGVEGPVLHVLGVRRSQESSKHRHLRSRKAGPPTTRPRVGVVDDAAACEIGEYGVSWIACGEPCLRAGAGICRPGVRVARRDPGAPRRPGSTAEERYQRGVGFLRIGPADVVWAVLDLDDGEVRDQLFVSQPCGGRLERQDPVGGAMDH